MSDQSILTASQMMGKYKLAHVNGHIVNARIEEVEKMLLEFSKNHVKGYVESPMSLQDYLKTIK